MDYMEAIRTYRKEPGKRIVKRGTVACDVVESTPVVWKGRLLRFEWQRNFNDENRDPACCRGYFHFVDFETGKESTPFAHGHSLGSAYVEGDRAYAIGTTGWGGNTLDLFESSDLETWKERRILSLPEDWKCYNTSLCRGKDCYILAIEIETPEEIAGVSYTTVFAKSHDLVHFEMIEPHTHVYTKDHYSACPCLRYVGGYYYLICLEPLPYYKFVPILVRSTDLSEWEPAPVNPVFFYDDGDRLLAGDFTEEEKARIRTALDTNNSDVDLCEFEGKTVITYSWGNQMGTEFLAYAEFPGSMQEFFESFY